MPQQQQESKHFIHLFYIKLLIFIKRKSGADMNLFINLFRENSEFGK